MKRSVDTIAPIGLRAALRRAVGDRPIGLALVLLAGLGQPALANGPTTDAVAAPSGAAYTAGQWTVDGGGGRSSGGTYTITGTIAQPDSDPLQPSTGGSYAIIGGFWAAIDPSVPTPTLFADGFETVTGSATATAAAGMPQGR